MKKFSWIIMLISLPVSLMAGAWLKGTGHGYGQFSYTYLEYNSLLNGDRLTHLNRNVSDFTFQLYSEYGIGKGWDLQTVIPYKYVATSNNLNSISMSEFQDTLPAGNLNALGNVQLVLKRKIWEGNYCISAQIGFWLPSAVNNQINGLRSGYDAFGILPQLSIGKGRSKSYSNFDIGYLHRSNNYGDVFLTNVEHGFRTSLITETTWLILVANIFLSMDNGSYTNGTTEHTGLYMSTAGFVSPAFKMILELKNDWHLNYGMGGAAWARYGGAFPTFTLGVAKEW